LAVWGSLSFVALAACNDNENTPAFERETTTTSSDASGFEHPFTFNDLNANSPTIEVYPGFTDLDEHEVPNGRFNDGDVVNAICKATGREVESVPPEDLRISDRWVGIEGDPGEEQYAPLTYGDIALEDLEALPEC
jgi:hypothetical protein